MSSKRLLYKPAIQSEIGPREGRRRLAQGRLTSQDDQTSGGGHRPTLVHGTLENTDPHPAGDVSYTASLAASARRDLTSLLKADTSFQTDNNPRRVTPHVSMHSSTHEDTKPSDSLDLSDDSEVIFNTRGVLVVDASKKTHSADDTEVDVQVEYQQSPVKVICHTSSDILPDIRGSTGDVSEARQVSVDTIPSVCIQTNSSLHGNREEAEGEEPPEADNLRPKQPLVVRETTAGSPTTRPQAAKSLFEHIDDLPSPRMHHSQDDSATTAPPIQQRSQLSASETSLDSLERSDESNVSHSRSKKRQTGTSQSKVSQRKAPPKTKSAALSTSNIKSKKPVRVVQSRYMQSTAPAKKGPMKATDRSIMAKPSSTVPVGRKASTSTRKTNTPSKKKKTQPSPGPTQSTFSTTPEVKGQGGKVSTPTADGSLFIAPGGVDISAIVGPNAAHSHHQYSLDSTPGLSESHLLTSRSSTRSHGSLPTSRKESDYKHTSHTDSVDKKKPCHMTQKKLDLSYSRYVQWLFLESKAKRAFQDQEKQVMTQLHGLHTENERLRRQNHELDLQLARMQHLNMLDDMLETQCTGLTPVVSSIPHVKGQYSKLAEALDTTRHQMPARGILIPEDESQFVEELSRALRESEQLLGELSTMVKPVQPKMNMFTDSMQTMEKSLESEVNEMAKVKELLAAMKTLTTQENSLYIQEIQEE